ncbi:unnamed protein product, partial [Gulo gulo]
AAGGWGKRKCGVPGPGSSAWGGGRGEGCTRGPEGGEPTRRGGLGCGSCVGTFPAEGPAAWRVGGGGPCPSSPLLSGVRDLSPVLGAGETAWRSPGGGLVGPRRGKPAADGETAAGWVSAPSWRPWAAPPHLELLGGGWGGGGPRALPGP